MAVPLQNQRVALLHSARGGNRYCTFLTSCRTFTAPGPSFWVSWSCNGSASLTKPDLSTSLTNLTPIFSSRAIDWCSRSKAFAGIVCPTSSAAACTQPFCSSLRLFQTLSLTQTTLLFASCSG